MSEHDVQLCHVDDIADGGAKGVEFGDGAARQDVILLRRGEDVFAYLNRCPHQGTPLETFPDRFLDRTGEVLICSTHGARFRVRDGFCVKGPCEGASLEAFEIRIEEGRVYAKKRR